MSIHMSNVKVHDSFLSIGHITTAQASPHYLFARSESLLFLDSIPPGLNWYLASDIKSLHVISNFSFVINPQILWIWYVSCENWTGLSESITSASDLWQWRHLSLLYRTLWFARLLPFHLFLWHIKGTYLWCPFGSLHPATEEYFLK